MKKFKDLSATAKKEVKEHYSGVQHQHPHGKMNYDDVEGRMAKQSLYKLHKYSRELFEMLDDHTELEAWVQDKISRACSYISSVKHFLEYEMDHGSEDNPYEEFENDDDQDMIEDVHHIDDLIPLLKQIYKVQESHKINLKNVQVIVEPDDAGVLYETYKKLNDENKKEFSKKIFESKEDFWNMVSFSRSRGE
jgi:hypothetical protein